MEVEDIGDIRFHFIVVILNSTYAPMQVRS